ncbi:hypothetical protein F8388_002401, partial [Cannabis sativa]
QVTSNGSEAPVVDQEDVTVAGDSTTRDELASAAVKLQKLYKDYQICKDKDEAEVWFSGLKALISRGHHRKWRNEFRSDGIPSEANKPRTYTRRSSPLHSPFDSILKQIGYENHMKVATCDYSKLYFHCQEFKCFARGRLLHWGSSLECRFFSEWNSATIVSIGPPKEEKKDGKKDMSSENAWVRMLLNSLSSQQSCKLVARNSVAANSLSVQNLSSGQKQRVAIAGALAEACKVLLLDELTTFLDETDQLGVIKAVRNSLDSSEEVTALWVTHRLEELEYADGAVYMEDGRVVKHGDAKTILEFIKGRQSAYIKQINS